MLDRRTFLKSSAGLVAAGVCLPGFACSGSSAGRRKLDKIGVQLYTIRTEMAKDFEGALRRVAEIGYDEVEFAGYYDREAKDVAALLQQLNLKAPAAHMPLQMVEENMPQAIETAKTIGHEYIICPWINRARYTTVDAYKQLAATFNKAGKACKAAGLKFGYHNHNFEFEAVEGQLPMDILLKETDPDLVDMEIDLYWITFAGSDPLVYFKNYPGRFKLCHVKDMGPEKKMMDVGKGELDFAAIFAQADQAGLEHFIVEHDQPADPFASIEASLKYLRALEF